jgi:agmatine deiminase
MLYFSDLLLTHVPNFFCSLKMALDDKEIAYSLLRRTKDIWMRDFMPVRTADGQWVQFKYAPDYLMRSARGQATITDPTPIRKWVGVDVIKTDIIADGGNIVICGKTALACHKLLRDNPSYAPHLLVDEVKRLLGVERLVLLPQEPGDRFGHADGMARFLNEDTVIANDYSWRRDRLRWDLKAALLNAGLRVIEVPYDPRGNTSTLSARGNYLNFLYYCDTLFLPTFDTPEDNTMLNVFRGWFKDVVPVDCTELAREGGLLHCISWVIPETQ